MRFLQIMAMSRAKGEVGRALCRSTAAGTLVAVAAGLSTPVSANGFRQLDWSAILVPVQAEAQAVVADEVDLPQDGSKAEALNQALSEISERLSEQQRLRDAGGRDLLANEIRAAREEVVALRESLSEVRAQRDGLLVEMTAARTELQATRDRLKQSKAESQIASELASATMAELDGRIGKLDTQITALKDENTDLSRQLGESSEQIAVVRQSVNDAWQERDAFEQSLAATAEQLKTRNAELTRARAGVTELGRRLTVSEAGRGQLEEDVTALAGELDTARQAASAADEETERVRTQAARQAGAMQTKMVRQNEIAEARAQKLGDELSTLGAAASAAIAEVRRLGDQLIETMRQNEEFIATIGELRATKELLADELNAARRDVKLYAAEAAALRKQTISGAPTEPADGEPLAGVAEDGPELLTQLVAMQNTDAASETFQAAGTNSGDPGEDGGAGTALETSLSELNAVETDDGWLMMVPDGIDFAPGSAQLTNETADVLGRLATLIKSYGSNAVRIVGHTDSNGEAAVNQRLSERRAQSVKRYLVETHEIVDAVIATEGFGESRPIASNSSIAGRKVNRRVEVYLRR